LPGSSVTRNSRRLQVWAGLNIPLLDGVVMFLEGSILHRDGTPAFLLAEIS